VTGEDTDAALARLFGALKRDTHMPIKNRESAYSQVFFSQAWLVAYKDGTRVTLACDRNELLEYRAPQAPEPPQGLTRSDAISKEQVLERARTFLSALGKPNDVEAWRVGYQDLGDTKKGDLQGGQWALSTSFQYQGVECVGKGIVLHISAYTGEVLFFVHFPIIVPKTMNRSVAAEDAAEKALGVCRTLFPGRECEISGTPELVIAHPNEYWTEKRDPRPKGFPRLSWRVKCTEKGSASWQSERVLFVDAATGQVIGGFS
jgi:hypothetical protein